MSILNSIVLWTDKYMLWLLVLQYIIVGIACIALGRWAKGLYFIGALILTIGLIYMR